MNATINYYKIFTERRIKMINVEKIKKIVKQVRDKIKSKGEKKGKKNV